MRFDQITIVGLGLIGGSIGLAAKARGLARHVVGVDCNHTLRARAIETGVIDEYCSDLPSGASNADIVVVCTPVNTIADTILSAASLARNGTLFTDAGSTKGNIITAIGSRLPGVVHYVPAHPLAGAEKNGIEHARADLFENRVTVVTPTVWNALEEVSRVEQFWMALGSRVVRMQVEEHDRVLAMTSHLPHAVAAAVSGITPVEWLAVTAGGFRDVTRIAAGDPALWAAIFEANGDQVLASLELFRTRLGEFERLLMNGDGAGLLGWLSEAKRVRDALGS